MIDRTKLREVFEFLLFILYAGTMVFTTCSVLFGSGGIFLEGKHLYYMVNYFSQ